MEIRRKLLPFLIAAWIALGACSTVSAQMGQMPNIAQLQPAPSGAGPTWTAQTSAVNNACGFVTSCSVTGVSVTSGLVVVAVGGNNQTAGSSNINAVTVCGTSLTAAQNPTSGANSDMIALFYGTVTGGSCTVTATASATGAFQAIGVALGTLSNLSSTSPGIGCNATFNNTQASPYPCSSGIAVSSGGFAIAGFSSAAGETFTSSNLTIDSQTSASLVSIAIGHSSATGSMTPQYGAGNFDNVGIAAAPWR